MLCSLEVGLREQLGPEGTEEATSSFLIQLCHRQPYSSSTLNISVTRIKCYRPCFTGEGPKAREAVELESGRDRRSHVFLSAVESEDSTMPLWAASIYGHCY